MSSPKSSDKKVTNEKPISLAGVDFKELIKAFLKITPEAGGKKPPQKNVK